MDTEGNSDRWFSKSGRELTEDIEKAGLKDRLKPFNDVLHGSNAPGGYGDPVLTNIEIDGRTCDIYHTDKKPGDSYHRIYIHTK